jgi:NodT family efflux transporter outer membrane factor (OMF) lipoprotein
MNLPRRALRRTMLVIAFGLAVAGCAHMSAVAPTQKPLAANSLDAGADIRSAARADWPDTQWWRKYAYPQLDRLVQQALVGNPSLAGAQARIAVARGLARISNAATGPTVAARADSELTRFSHDDIFPEAINGHYLFDPIFNTTAELTFAFDPDFWGRDRAALEAALDQVQVSAYEAQGARLVLETTVVRSYAQLGYAFELQDHENAILAAEQKTLSLAQRRLQAGLGTELEIQQARSAVAATQAVLQEITGQILSLRHQIAALLGQGPAAGDSLNRPALDPNRPVGLPSQMPAELIGRRPDIQAERWRVASAAQGMAVAKAEFYPNIDLRAAVGLVGFGFGRLVSAQAVNATAGPAITLPIFDGGRLQAGLDVRMAQYDAAVYAYDSAVIEALRQVSDQISRFESLRELRMRREETLAFAKRANELARIAFRAGLTDYNNVLSTEDALNRALISISDVNLQQLVTIAALNEALGGGLAPAAGPSMVSR